MERYNRIEYFNKIEFGKDCIAFEKIDGSNVRFQWNRKNGFYKFGTRNNLINREHEDFGESIDIFLNKYSDPLEKIFIDKYGKVETFVVFGEFYGQNSFAGLHFDESKDVKIFDIHQYKRGIISPYEFVENFGHLDIPKLVYKGEYNHELIQSIRENHFSLKEGVICKGVHRDEVWMTKIKTKEWLERVKNKLGEKALLEELNNDKRLLNYGN